MTLKAVEMFAYPNCKYLSISGMGRKVTNLKHFSSFLFLGKVVTKDKCEKSFESHQIFTDGIFRDWLINKTEVAVIGN